MNFGLTADQKAWQQKAREFAMEEIRPLSMKRDAVPGPRETWDWEIIKKGSALGFRTLAVPKDWGGPGTDFVTQGLVMAELAKGDSAISKAFSQNWKWSHLIAEFCTNDQKERFLKPFLADDTYVIGSASTEPNAGSDNRYPPADAPKSGWRLSAKREGDDWLLNGEKTFIANGSVGKLFFVSTRTDPDVAIREGTTVFLVPNGTPGFRVGKIFNKSGWRFYQNAELIFDNARVPHANVVGEVHGGVKVRSGAAGEFGDFELAANALGVCDAACEQAMQLAKSHTRGGKRGYDHQLVQLKLNEMFAL
ncbi:MAG: acyl-CoA dehydrogenase, partial [Betaproteobacteria bacterium]|nr:acyl-CoA dehydrogenase [Betaproteobacteria bacterium]